MYDVISRGIVRFFVFTKFLNILKVEKKYSSTCPKIVTFISSKGFK